MAQMGEINWMVLGAALLVVVLVAVWLFSRASKPARRSYKPDVLDEGVGPAQRNQSLIDATPAADLPPAVIPPASEILGGIGEVIAAAAHEEKVDAVPPAPLAVAADSADDLTRIKGLGPKLRTLLHGLGVTSFAQIAAWTDEDVARIDAQLGTFAGRPVRDSWVEQAKFLAAADTQGFETKFGKV